jgi:hypothetical protein
MLLTNFSSLLPLFQFLPFGSAAEQKVLKGGKVSPLNAEFEKLVHETLELWHVPGVAIGVIDGDSEWSQVRIKSSFVEQSSIQVAVFEMREINYTPALTF